MKTLIGAYRLCRETGSVQETLRTLQLSKRAQRDHYAASELPRFEPYNWPATARLVRGFKVASLRSKLGRTEYKERRCDSTCEFTSAVLRLKIWRKMFSERAAHL